MTELILIRVICSTHIKAQGFPKEKMANFDLFILGIKFGILFHEAWIPWEPALGVYT
jgi:hypothetical protein